MSDDLEQLKKLASQLMVKMGKKTDNHVRMGFGSFVDRPLSPIIGPVINNNILIIIYTV